jgi:hypothetical protein
MTSFEVITSVVFRCGNGDAYDCPQTYTLRAEQLPFEWDHEGERDELLRRYVPPQWLVVGCAHDGAEHEHQRRKCTFHRRVVCSPACARRLIDLIVDNACALT